MKLFLRAPLGLGVLLLISACEIGPIGVPSIEIPTMPAAFEVATAPAVVEVSGASQDASVSYGIVSSYIGASDALSDGRGLTDSRTLSPAECGRGCVPTPGKRPLDASRDKLIDDTVKNVKGGGTSVIRVTGSVDNQQKSITPENSKKLAANRALDTAQTIAKEIRQDLRAAGANPDVRVVAAGTPAAATCGTGTRTCVVYQAHPQVLSSCKSPANGGCQLDLGRAARADAVHSSGGSGITCLDQSCMSTSDTVAVDPTGVAVSGGGGGGTTPNPGEGVFGVFPPAAWPGSNSGSNSGSNADNSGIGNQGSSTFDDSYFTLYPEDRFDIDALSVRIVLDVPRTFRVGGTLTQQEVAVKEVAVYCDNSPCSGVGSPSVASLAGRLTLAANNVAYRLCTSERSSNCEYYLTANSTSSVGLSGAGLTGGRIEVGFRSPTGSKVRVLPTLTVDEISVFVYDPEWVGGVGCDADLPPKSCWEWVPSFERDLTNSVSVVTTAGETLLRSASGFRLERQVYGTVGSN